MRMLLIFDQEVDQDRLRRKIGLLKPGHISLFPLTSDWSAIRAVERACRSQRGADVELMESAKLVDADVDLLGQNISRWSAELGDRKISGRSIKEWFLLPRGELSTWWLSLPAEKNPIKTDIFFNIAQLNAIDKVISSGRFDICILSLSRGNVLKSAEKISKRCRIETSRVPSVRKKMSFKERIASCLAEDSVVYVFLKTMAYLRVYLPNVMTAKSVMGPLAKRREIPDNHILFVSYFPLVDKRSAKEGSLKNRYAIPLQQKIARMGKKVVWIWMYASMDGYSFRDASKLAAKFSEHGETNFFVEEFMSLGLLIRSLLLWLRQIGILVRLNKKIPDRFLYENLSVPETAALVRGLITESFAGCIGLNGIVYFELYKKIFSRFAKASHCIYCFEMHAWEKALNAAKRLTAPAVKTIAFQHSFVPRNYFPYFCHPSETGAKRGPLSLPLPDILTCNGDIPFGRMSKSGYPDLRKVEAVRYSHLSPHLNTPHFSAKEKILLICCPLMRDKAKALISLFYETFPHPGQGFKVWLKGHPTLPLEGILEELGISTRRSGCVIKHEPIAELLKTVNVVLAGGTSVAVEALACGCKVILPVFADCIFFNPLDEFDRFYTKVSNPSEFKQAVCRIMENRDKTSDKRDIDDFISHYWCFDDSLKRWEEVLSK